VKLGGHTYMLCLTIWPVRQLREWLIASLFAKRVSVAMAIYATNNFSRFVSKCILHMYILYLSYIILRCVSVYIYAYR